MAHTVQLVQFLFQIGDLELLVMVLKRGMNPHSAVILLRSDQCLLGTIPEAAHTIVRVKMAAVTRSLRSDELAGPTSRLVKVATVLHFCLSVFLVN